MKGEGGKERQVRKNTEDCILQTKNKSNVK